jgi:hypothetical protein
VHRVAYLVEQGVPAERILLLTFTNRAAREMLERAEKLVPSVGGIWSGTFHHVCARFLRRYGSFLGYRPGFAILDEDDQKKLMNECIKALVKTPKDFVKKELLLKMLSDAKNRERPFEAVVKSYQTKTALDVEEVIKVGRIRPNGFDKTRLSVKKTRRLVVTEDVCAFGSVGAQILSSLAGVSDSFSFRLLNLGDGIVQHGSVEELRHLCGIDAQSIAQSAKALLGEE